MSEISTEIIIANVVNGMMSTLDDAQLKKLKDQLYIQLHDVDIVGKKYELSEAISENDTMKLQYFEASMKISKMSEGTIKQYVRSAKLLRGFLMKDYKDITAQDIKYFLAYCQKERGWSDVTLSNMIHNLQAFYKFLMREELIPKNPMLKIEPVKLAKIVKKPFTSVEMEKMRTVCRNKPRESALLEFLYATGIRIDELVRLKWNDLDIRHLDLTVRGKGNKYREVEFSERAGFYLLRYFDERMKVEGRSREEMMERPLFAAKKRSQETHDFEAISDDGIRYLLKQIGKEAAVDHVHPHKFRRTFATDAINHGMPLEHLMILMGHSQHDTTLGYAHIKSNMVDQSYRMYCD